MEKMFRLKMLYRILKLTKTDRILLYYIVFVLISALLILLFEPDITNYIDALWYCYAVISTAGFGDIVVHTFFAKIVSVIVTVYSTIAIAMLTGVIVSYYNEILDIKKNETITACLDKIERLPELSTEERKELSEKVHSYRLK